MKLIKVLVASVFLQAICAASNNHVDRLYQRYTECLKNKKDTHYNKSELKQDLDDVYTEYLDYGVRQERIRNIRIFTMRAAGATGLFCALVRSGMQGAPVRLKAFLSGVTAFNFLACLQQFVLLTVEEFSDDDAALESISQAIQRERKKLEDVK